MRGMLLKHDAAEYIVAVEYLLEESGAYFEGGLRDWEGSFIPALPYRLDASAYVLELEDGRRGSIAILQRYAVSDQPTIYRFRGQAGLRP